MSVFTPTLASRWKTAKTEFEGITGKHKPKEKLGGLIQTSYTGLHKTLEACEAAAKDVSLAVTAMNSKKIKPDAAKGKIADYKKKYGEFQQSVTQYTALLNSEIRNVHEPQEVKSL